MLGEIRALIEEKEYQRALDIIRTELAKRRDLTLVPNEQLYAELLGLRVAAEALMGKTDEVIHDAVRKEKFPTEQTHIVAGKYSVGVIARNLFSFPCDAMINSIHAENLFQVSNRSATFEFVSRLGEDFVHGQIRSQPKEKGGFIVLEHEGLLAAPRSFHILCYEGHEVNFEALEKGLRAVLKECERRGYQKVGSFPLGFGYVADLPEQVRGSEAKKIADKLAEIVVTHLWEKDRATPPCISFNAIQPKTFDTLDRAFLRWSSLEPAEINARRRFEERLKGIVEDTCTTDPVYIEKLRKVSYTAPEDNTILILGETGVGKSFLAERIHRISTRAPKKFRSLNCAYVSPDHLFTHLFGWKKGSYTGASGDGEGLIEAAEGSTLFLDEIGHSDISVQRGLLTFLDRGIYNRFGDTTERSANVRLVFGTNQNLADLIQRGLFEETLYERIAQVVIEIPPLRSRKGDIKLLALKIIDELNRGKEYDVSVDDEAMAVLGQYKWPGNIRQLRFFLQNQYVECVQKKTFKIARDAILNAPPRDQLYRQADPLESLEIVIANLITQWNPENGNLIRDLIEPIAAKVYLQDLKLNKTDAMKVLGIDGTRGDKSTIEQRYRQYDNLKRLSNSK